MVGGLVVKKDLPFTCGKPLGSSTCSNFRAICVYIHIISAILSGIGNRKHGIQYLKQVLKKTLHKHYK